MLARASLAIAAFAAGITASSSVAQELVTFHWSFGEVIAGTTVPVANPDGFIGPGEAAELRLTVSFSPDVGQPITYTPPPPPGHGFVGGLASVFFHLDGDPTAVGSFSYMRRGPGFTVGVHNPQITPTSIYPIQVGQIAFPETPLNNSTNPAVNAWRVVWTPEEYTERIVTFTGSRAAATPGTGAAVYIQYGGTPEQPLWTSKQLPADFGSVQIPIIPSPSSLVLMTLGGVLAARRRR